MGERDDTPASDDDLTRLLARVPDGWTRVAYDGRAWGLSRTAHAAGRTVTLHAEQLGGTGLVSANVWLTSTGPQLRPCEMPAADVLDFLRGWAPDRTQDGAARSGDHAAPSG